MTTTHFFRNYAHQPSRTCFETESRRDLEPLGVTRIKVDVSGIGAFHEVPDGLGSPSKEAESRRLHEDTP